MSTMRTHVPVHLISRLARVSIGINLFLASTMSFGAPASLVAAWAPPGLTQDLKTWTLKDLRDTAQFKRHASQERDPLTGKLTRWEGVLLSQLVEKVLNDLPVESRARVDLVVLKGSQGERAQIPRALISKYPIFLALQGDSVSLGNRSTAHDRGPIFSVVPWSSKPKILSEDLPLENYFVSRLNRIELTSYKDQYSSLFLKRRTDPFAMRGEKLFVQNCVSCHALEQGPGFSGMTQNEQKEKQFTAAGHPSVKVTQKLTERDRRSIMRYLNAHRMENPVSVSKFIHSVQAQP
jgi:hypothetical protein